MDWNQHVRAAFALVSPAPDAGRRRNSASMRRRCGRRARRTSHDEALRAVDALLSAWQRDASTLGRRPRRATVVEPPAASEAWLSGVLQDARYGARLLKREPGFAAVAILTIALGIGATTTLFSVANGVLLKPLPWAESDRLVRLTETREGKPARIRGTITNGTFLAWQAGPALVEAIGAYNTNTVTAAPAGGEPARLQLGSITPSMFAVLKVQPLIGRPFELADAPVAAASMVPVTTVILSYGLWQEWFGGRPDVLGKTIDFASSGVSRAVVGVMPRGFSFPDEETRAWIPMPMASVLAPGGGQRIQIFPALARMKPGVSLQQASAEGTAPAAPDRDTPRWRCLAAALRQISPRSRRWTR